MAEPWLCAGCEGWIWQGARRGRAGREPRYLHNGRRTLWDHSNTKRCSQWRRRLRNPDHPGGKDSTLNRRARHRRMGTLRVPPSADGLGVEMEHPDLPQAFRWDTVSCEPGCGPYAVPAPDTRIMCARHGALLEGASPLHTRTEGSASERHRPKGTG